MYIYIYTNKTIVGLDPSSRTVFSPAKNRTCRRTESCGTLSCEHHADCVLGQCDPELLAGWWFQIFFIFIPNFGEDSQI